MPEELVGAEHVVGVKQTRRAIASGKAVKVFAAVDADPALVEPIVALAKEAGLPVEEEATMKDLGHACGIAVGAAVAAIVTK